MPMVWRCNRNHIQRFVIQSSANVLNTNRLIATLLAHFLASGFEQAVIGVDQASHPCASKTEVLIDVPVPLPVNAGDAHIDDIICSQHPPRCLGASDCDQRNCAACSHPFQEAASSDSGHELLLPEGHRIDIYCVIVICLLRITTNYR